MYYTTTCSMRRPKEAGRRRWRLHMHGPSHAHMLRLHGPPEGRGRPGAKAPTAALTCCCVVVRRCVARGDVHGDATIPVYIRCAGNSQPYEKGRRSERAWRDVMHMWALLFDWKREGAGDAERHMKQDVKQDGRYSLNFGTFDAQVWDFQHLACASSWSQLHRLRRAAICPQRSLRA